MSTLYRKYRPQNFTEVVGQNHIKVTLEQEIKTDKITHAYLFCGPRAVGKTTLARVLAKSINCEKRKKDSANPCNTCLSCSEITDGRALDIIEIDAASHTGVENVRENIIASARVAPSRSKYKVFIIDEVHMLSAQAFNALLKVIEEPPANVIFILCTTEAHKVPATIISRCQRFDFKRIGVNDAVKKLTYIIQAEKIKIAKDILEAIARHADGHMRDAESLLGQIIAIGGTEIS
ncbi:DNA polymerase III subunit gamma/tau, partial [Patescibacteria group bacterium]|nr:DNA polymerase III subunit gamma/tau [Patescibacteria group bacterium]